MTRQSNRYLLFWSIMTLFCLTAGWGCGKASEETGREEVSITISGSASAMPIVRVLAEAYEEAHPYEKIHFLPSVHSVGGVMGAVDGTIDIGVVSRKLTLEEEEFQLCRYPFAKDLLVFAVHSGVKVRELSTRELLEIYSGGITNWRELGGGDQEIVVLDRPGHTSARQAVQKNLFGEDFVVTREAVVLERPRQMDDSLQNIPGSIGYTSYSSLSGTKLNIPLLGLDGVMPSLEKSVMERGKSVFRIYAFLLKGRPQGLTKRFIEFVYSPSGREMIHSKGVIPEHRKVVIALAPAVNIVEQESRYRPLIEYLSRKSGIPIELKHTASYQEMVHDFINKDFDGAFLGSFAYALVHHQTPLEILGRPQERGQAYYTGILFVRHDSRIQSFEDLRGKTFCFVDKATTAGYLFPLIYFKERGISDPEKFLGKILFSGSHDASILSVLNGEADAGVAKDLVLMKAGEKDPRAALDLIMVDTSPPVPTNGLCVRRNLDADLREDLKRTLLNMGRDEEGRAVLKRFGADCFLPTSDKDYKNLYTMLETLEIDLKDFFSSGGGAEESGGSEAFATPTERKSRM